MNKKEPFFHIVKRDALPWYQSVGVRAIAIVLALVLCGILTTITTGIDPIEVYKSIFAGAFGTERKTWITLQNLSILLLIALALTPAFKMKFWNIGAEGQILVGAIAAGWFGLFTATIFPKIPLVLLMMASSMILGGLYGLLPAICKAKWGTNETLFTLMMNYIALQFVVFLEHQASWPLEGPGQQLSQDCHAGSGRPSHQGIGRTLGLDSGPGAGGGFLCLYHPHQAGL